MLILLMCSVYAAEAFCVLHNLSAEYCSILSEHSTLLHTQHHLDRRGGEAIAATTAMTDTEGGEVEVAVEGENAVGNEEDIVHSIPVIVLSATGESVEVPLALRDSQDPRKQVSAFCATYALPPHICSQLMDRAVDIYNTYETFMRLLRQDPVSSEDSATSSPQEGGAASSAEEEKEASSRHTQQVIQALPVQVWSNDEYVDVEFLLYDDLNPRLQAEKFCAQYEISDDFCVQLKHLASDIYSAHQIAESTSALSEQQPDSDSDGDRDGDRDSDRADLRVTGEAAAPPPSPLVLDILAWGLSSDFLAVGAAATGGAATASATVSPPLSAAANGGGRADVQEEERVVMVPQRVLQGAAVEASEEDKKKDSAFWTSFALSEEYFDLVATRRTA
jgi:hypothetical protein